MIAPTESESLRRFQENLPRYSALLAGTILLLAIPSEGKAQSAELSTFRDSLHAISSVDELGEFTRRSMAGLDSTSASASLYDGFAGLRTFEIAGGSALLDSALYDFDRAIRKAPSDNDAAWASYGRALVLLERAGTRGALLESLRSGAFGRSLTFGGPDKQAGHRALREALKRDPTFEPAAVFLALFALDTRREPHLETAVRAFEAIDRMEESTMAAAPAVPPAPGTPPGAVELLRAQLAHASGDYQAAALWARRGQEMGALSLLHEADAHFQIPEHERPGTEAYFEGLETAERGDLDRYFLDIAEIVSEAERERWQEATHAERREFLRQFWALKAASAGLTLPEILAEHYRRLAWARAQPGTVDPFGQPTAYRELLSYEVIPSPDQITLAAWAESREHFTARGHARVRYGAPHDEVRQIGHETWVYRLPAQEPLLFYFGGEGFGGIPGCGPSDNPAVQAEWFSNHAWLYGKFGAIYLRCQRPADSYARELARHDIRRLNHEYRERVADALESSFHQPIFERDLRYFYDLYTFRGDSGDRSEESLLLAALAVPAEQLDPEERQGWWIYSLDASLIVFDSISGDVARTDTTLAFRSDRQLEKGELARAHLELAAPPLDSASYRLVLRQSSTPAFGHLHGGMVNLPDFGDESIRVSDVLIAEAAEDGTWQRGEESLALAPGREFPIGESFTVFYEIYNLEAGSRYRTDIVVAPEEAEGVWENLTRLVRPPSDGLHLSFEEEAPDDIGAYGVQHARTVATSDLSAGRFRIRVQVTDLESGAMTSRDRILAIGDAAD